MKKSTKRIATRFKIVGAFATIFLSFFALFTSTFAWFSVNRLSTVTGGSFTVKPVSGISYDIYYLDHFVVNEANVDGNYNSYTSTFAGYEVSYATPVFIPVLFNDDGQVIDDQNHILPDSSNPTNISNLWPAHKLTFALVISSTNFTSFSLDSWDEITNPLIKTKNAQSQDVLISLSWAINIYGAAYGVAATNSITADIATGFSSFYRSATLGDAFGYKQTYGENEQAPVLPLTIVDTVDDQSGNSDPRQILYFTIEFDNSEDTYYDIDDEDTSYYKKTTSGNSNCYKQLSLRNLIFKIA